MRNSILIVLAAVVVLVVSTAGTQAESIVKDNSLSFPDLTGKTAHHTGAEHRATEETTVRAAVWPFGGNKGDEAPAEIKPKSTRKAFFLSFLVPGLGEAYVGSKDGLIFLGLEAFSWWMYITNTKEGKDIERDFRRFADSHWHYTETTGSEGQTLDHNYWKWLQYQFRWIGLPDDIDPYDYELVNEQLEKTVQHSDSPIFGYSIHDLPSKKTQQYYEMIGKYPQFVYGWEDIGERTLNPTIRNDDGSINFNVSISLVKSPLRMKYEDMRDDSNRKLKAGQRGIHLMILGRILSGIRAARLAYHHNKKIDSELSSLRLDIVEKYIIDNRVPMLMLTKKF